MASYDAELSPQPEANNSDEKKISFRFCRECSNMLYPKEDRETNMLLFACRTCHFSEPATVSCIYRNSLKEEIAETAGNVEDVAQDPTVGDSSARDATMQGTNGHGGGNGDGSGNGDGDGDGDGDDQDPIIPELCTFCGQEILCPICEQPTDAAVALEVADPTYDASQYGEDMIEAERRERALSGATFTGH